MAHAARAASLALLEVSLSSACVAKMPCRPRSSGRRPLCGAKVVAANRAPPPRPRPRRPAAATAASEGRVQAPLAPGVLNASQRHAPRQAPPAPPAAVAAFVADAAAGRFPSPQECDRLFAGLCAARRFAEARQAYRAAAPRVPPLRYNTYQALINACLAVGDLDTALEVFRDLQDAGGMAPNQVTYCCLISALGKARRRGARYGDVAYELWAELRNSSYGASLDAAALRAGMKACADVGRVGEAEALLTRAAAQRVPLARDVRTYNILLKGYATRGGPQATEAMEGVMDRMAAAGVAPSCVTYNILVDSHVQAGELGAARERMAAARAAGLELDAWSYTSLIKGCAAAGDVAGAAAVFAAMQAAGVRPTCITYSTLINGHARAGDLPAARALLADMIAAGEAPSAVTFNSLLRAYARLESQPDALRQALQLLDDMQAQGVAPAADTFNTLMSAAVAAGEAPLAIDLHGRMQAAGLRPDGVTFTVLLQAHAALGQVSQAVAAFEALSRDPAAAMDIAAYNAMVNAFAVAGDMAAAENMLEAACEFAARAGLPPPLQAYGAVVSGYVMLKQVAPAVATVRRFNAAGGTPDVQMLDMLADLCVRTGEFKLAMQAVRSMELIGAEVDKEKYRAMVVRRMERAASGGGKPAVAAAPAAAHGRGSRADKNTYLERFKFWLGLPNSYYNDSDAEPN